MLLTSEFVPSDALNIRFGVVKEGSFKASVTMTGSEVICSVVRGD
jgi:hypothetical protein